MKAERSVITAPPSVHATGQRYVWVPGRDPDELTPATVPGWLKGIAHREAGANRQKPIHEQPARTRQEQDAFAEAWARTGIELESGTAITSVRSTRTIILRFTLIASTAAGIALGVGAAAGLAACDGDR